MPLISSRQSWESSMPSMSLASTSTSTSLSAASSRATSASSTTKIALALVSTYCAGWGAYYLAQDTIRRNVIKKRRKRHDRRRQQAQSIASKEAADKEHVEAIQERFGSLSVLGRYCNPFPEWREQGAWEFVVWKTWFVLTKGKLWSDGGVGKLKRTEKGRQEILDTLPSSTPAWNKYNKRPNASSSLEEESWDELSKSELVTDKPKASLSSNSSDAGKIQYTWIGQSTMLLSYGNLNILTDPVFGHQPVPSIFSPNRITPQPCSFTELISNVSLDVIVVSHNHYDHFDAAVVPLVPEEVTWIIPLGMRKLLTSCGKRRQDKIVELDWWEMKELEFKTGQGSSLRVQSIPAMHWSARTPLDTNQSLWTSYSLTITPDQSSAGRKAAHIYFSGDTGYSPTYYPHLSTVLKTSPDLAFIPIGSYDPKWHMSPQHIGPKESILIAEDIKAKKVVGMHWGTWIMSDEQWNEPPIYLNRELLKQGKDEKWFAIVKMGETNSLVLDDDDDDE
ncbi:unnamed protein product [Sympodiomycopsis kandeliae]